MNRKKFLRLLACLPLARFIKPPVPFDPKAWTCTMLPPVNHYGDLAEIDQIETGFRACMVEGPIVIDSSVYDRLEF